MISEVVESEYMHTIKTKRLATARYTARYTAADTQEIDNWFKAYRTMLRDLNIRKRGISSISTSKDFEFVA